MVHLTVKAQTVGEKKQSARTLLSQPPGFPGLRVFTLPNPLPSSDETLSPRPTDRQMRHFSASQQSWGQQGLAAYRQSTPLLAWHEMRDQLTLKVDFGDFCLGTEHKSK